MERSLIVDGQLFQTPAWHRGMGKYSLELLATLANFNHNHWRSIEIILSNHLPKDRSVVNELKHKVPQATIVYLDLRRNVIGDETIPETNREVVDTYIKKNNYQKLDYLVLSLMQGEIFPSFPSAQNVQKIVIIYDLIPLMFHDIYLQNPITRTEYLSKISELLRADKYLAISKTVANDLSKYLGIDRRRIASIAGGPIDHSKNIKSISVPKPFILMPTGNDLRKNNHRAIQAFEEFNREHSYKYSLVITSFFKDFEIRELSTIGRNVLFTGNVTGEELSYLYNETELLLFPPEYEGLGLPILEALEKNKPVACSDIAVFREMSEDAFNYFNPYSINDIKDALNKAINQKTVNHKAYKDVLLRYSWKRSVETTIGELSSIDKTAASPDSILHVAVFGPDPSKSLIGKLLQDNHAELSRLATADYYFKNRGEPVEPRVNYLSYITKSKEIRRGLSFQASKYDLPIYHIGSTEDSADILLIALAVPGIVVLYDLDLSNLWTAAVTNNLIDESRMELEKGLDDRLKLRGAKGLVTLIANQYGIIVFSDKHKSIVESIAKIVNPDVLTVDTSMPVNCLVYDEILPQRTIQYCLEKDAMSPTSTDFRNNDNLCRTEVIVAESGNPQIILEGMSFGAIPFLKRSKRFESLPEDIISMAVNAGTGEDIQKVANRDTYTKQSKHIINRVQNKYTNLSFAETLIDLIYKIKDREVVDG
jgi:glycosyltransferase involved in cell wall biosynthesis